MIARIVQQHIEERLSPKKAAIILGPRQVGKSTIIKAIIENQHLKVQQFNGDEPQVRAAFAIHNSQSHHTCSLISYQVNHIRINRGIKTWPAGA